MCALPLTLTLSITLTLRPPSAYRAHSSGLLTCVYVTLSAAAGPGAVTEGREGNREEDEEEGVGGEGEGSMELKEGIDEPRPPSATQDPSPHPKVPPLAIPAGPETKSDTPATTAEAAQAAPSVFLLSSSCAQDLSVWTPVGVLVGTYGQHTWALRGACPISPVPVL